MIRRRFRGLFGLTALLWLGGAFGNDSADLYATQCAACHGADALGNQALASPRLAGQNAAYLREQLTHYKQGLRGAHPADTQGKAMRALALNLSEEQINGLASYLETLASHSPPRKANASNPGAELYKNHCAVCHGQYGQGAEPIYVPTLRILSAWYLEASLTAYEQGWRGGANASTRAKGMRAISGQITDPTERRAIIEHLTARLDER